MSGGVAPNWYTILGAIGIGTILAAVVSWISAHSIAISNHRQNWINALRDDLAAFLQQLDVMYYRLSSMERPGATIEEMEKQQETRAALLLVYRRTLLRLNMREQSHRKLADMMGELLTIKSGDRREQDTETMVMQAQLILKEEWEVTKYGPLRPIFKWAKRPRKRPIHGSH